MTDELNAAIARSSRNPLPHRKAVGQFQAQRRLGNGHEPAGTASPGRNLSLKPRNRMGQSRPHQGNLAAMATGGPFLRRWAEWMIGELVCCDRMVIQRALPGG